MLGFQPNVQQTHRSVHSRCILCTSSKHHSIKMFGFDNDSALEELKKQVEDVVASFSSAAPASDCTIWGASHSQHPRRQDTYAYNGQTISSTALDNTSPLKPQLVHDTAGFHYIPATQSSKQCTSDSGHAGGTQHQSQKLQLQQAGKENSTSHYMVSSNRTGKNPAKPFPATELLDPTKHPVKQTSRKPFHVLSVNNDAQQQQQKQQRQHQLEQQKQQKQQVKPLCATTTISPQDALMRSKYCLPSHVLIDQQTSACHQNQQHQNIQEPGNPSNSMLHPTSHPHVAAADASPIQEPNNSASTGFDAQKNTAHHQKYSVTTSSTCNSSSSTTALPGALVTASAQSTNAAACCCDMDAVTRAVHVAAQHAANQPCCTPISPANNLLNNTSLSQPFSSSTQMSLSASKLCVAEDCSAASTLAGQWSDPHGTVAVASHYEQTSMRVHASISSGSCSQRQTQHERHAMEHAAAADTVQGNTEPLTRKLAASIGDIASATARNTTVPMAAPYTSCVVYTPAPFTKVNSTPTGQAKAPVPSAAAAAAAREQRRKLADTVVSAACATQALMSFITNHQREKSNTAVAAPGTGRHGIVAHNSNVQPLSMQATAVLGRANHIAGAAGGTSAAGFGSTSSCASVTGSNLGGRVCTAGGEHPQAWQQRQQGMHVGRPRTASTVRSILDPFTAGSSGSTDMVRPAFQQIGDEGVCQSRVLAATAPGQYNSSSKRALAAVASLAESAFARWRPAHTAASQPAAAPEPWQGGHHQHNASDLAHWDLAASSMFVAAPEAAKPIGKLSHSILPQFLQKHAAALQSARPAAVQAYLDPLAAQLRYPTRSGSAADASLCAAVHHRSWNSAGTTQDTVTPWGTAAGLSSTGSTIRQQMPGDEAEQQAQSAAAPAAGQPLAERNLLADNRLEEAAANLMHNNSSGSNTPQRLLDSTQNTRSHADNPVASMPMTQAVRRYLEQQHLQQGDLAQQRPVQQQLACSSSSSASNLSPAYVAAAARALQRLHAHQSREAAAAVGGGSGGMVAAAADSGVRHRGDGAAVCPSALAAAAASCESCAPRFQHMQSLIGNADVISAAAQLPRSAKGAAAAQAAALQQLHVPPHLLLELHLQLRKLTEEHARAERSRCEPSSTIATTVSNTMSHTTRPLSAAALLANVRRSESATESSGSSTADSLHDTAQSNLSYKLQQHLLVRSPYVGLSSGDVDYVATAVQYYHGMANCRDVFFIRHERVVSERQARAGARRTLIWGEKQARHQLQQPALVNELYSLE